MRYAGAVTGSGASDLAGATVRTATMHTMAIAKHATVYHRLPVGSPCAVTPLTAPKYAGLDKVNPGSVILSAEMMLRHMGWTEAADLIISSMEKAIGDKVVTYDFARLMDGATEVSCSAFGDAMIERM